MQVKITLKIEGISKGLTNLEIIFIFGNMFFGQQVKYKLSNQIKLKNFNFYLFHINHFPIPEMRYAIW